MRASERSYPENIFFELVGGEANIVSDNVEGLEYVISLLTEREQTILKARYINGETLEEVGKTFGVTRDRIRQIQAKALRKLRHPSRRKYYIKGKSVVEAEIKLLEELHEIEKQNYLNAIKEKWEQQQEERKELHEELKIDVSGEIETLDLSLRSYNCLKRAGINTVGELIQTSASQLKKVRNLGLKSYQEIEQKIADMGYSIIDDREG